MKKEFYHQFEMHHRGPRELIKERISAYLPYVDMAMHLAEDVQVLDLGCGRGEWLELMQERGIAALGVDVNTAMLEQCRSNRLKVEYCDAIKFLRSVPSSTYAVITAFHLVEHISFEQLQELVKQSQRVLLPGGILVLETPNPENVTVATNTFYLDPTHLRPLPPLLLSFLPDYYGFYRSRIMRMQGSAKILDKQVTTLYDVLNGASPDYAVVAQKAASPELLTLFDSLYSTSFGVDTDTLAQRFDGHIYQVSQQAQHQEERTGHLEKKASHLEKKANKLEERATLKEGQIEQLFEILEGTHQKIHELENNIALTRDQLNAIYLSRSWKITMPLRHAGQIIRSLYPGVKAWLTFAPMSRPHRVTCFCIKKLKIKLAPYPRLKKNIHRILAYLPWVNRFIEVLQKHSASHVLPSETDIDKIQSRGFMSPRASQIYSEIKSAAETKTGEHQ